jgi:hypothetical protein
MFELLSDDRPAIPHRGTVPLVIASTLHVIVVGALVAVPMSMSKHSCGEAGEVRALGGARERAGLRREWTSRRSRSAMPRQGCPHRVAERRRGTAPRDAASGH